MALHPQAQNQELLRMLVTMVQMPAQPHAKPSLKPLALRGECWEFDGERTTLTTGPKQDTNIGWADSRRPVEGFNTKTHTNQKNKKVKKLKKLKNLKKFY